jgi:hypothetical protein
MINCNQIFDHSKYSNFSIFGNQSDYYTEFLIVTALCLIIPSLYYLSIKRKNAVKVVPKKTIIIHDKQITTTSTEEKPSTEAEENFDISSCGGFIPYLRKLHANQGAHVSSNLPYPNTISAVDPMIVKATLSVGDRPIGLFEFLEPFLGKDNLQIFDADRADSFRKLVRTALGYDGDLLLYSNLK